MKLRVKDLWLQDFWVFLDTLKGVTSQFERKVNRIFCLTATNDDRKELIKEVPILEEKVASLTEQLEIQNKKFETSVAEKYRQIEELQRIKALTKASMKSTINEIV